MPLLLLLNITNLALFVFYPVSDIQENQVPQIEVDVDHVPNIKLLCGADLLESFAVPGLWEEEDVSLPYCSCVFITVLLSYGLQ